MTKDDRLDLVLWAARVVGVYHWFGITPALLSRDERRRGDLYRTAEIQLDIAGCIDARIREN